MNVTVASTGLVTTARLTGEIDTYTVPEVRAAFDELAVAGGGTVVVDLREVTFMDSSGLGAIIGLFHRVQAAGARLQLVCGGVSLRLVRLMHLDQVMEVIAAPQGAEADGGAPTADTQPSAPA
jgi:anti-sigma B factor antagonist